MRTSIVIHSVLITQQDLKDRYASVCRKLIRNRSWPGDESSKSQLLSSFSFDKGKLSLYIIMVPVMTVSRTRATPETIRCQSGEQDARADFGGRCALY